MPANKKPNTDTECLMIAQVLCRGTLDQTVTAVTGQAARDGKPQIRVSFGRILFYLEDRASLMALTAAVDRANELSERVFGPSEDERWHRTESVRRQVARTGKLPKSGGRDWETFQTAH